MKLPIFVKYTNNYGTEITRNVGEVDTETSTITLKPYNFVIIQETVSPTCSSCGRRTYK